MIYGAKMKAPAIDGVLSGSLPLWLSKFDRERPPQSLFSLLLQIESQLRSETRSDSLIQPRQRKFAKSKDLKQRGAQNLSRYVE
jgi:hypothetical protein